MVVDPLSEQRKADCILRQFKMTNANVRFQSAVSVVCCLFVAGCASYSALSVCLVCLYCRTCKLDWVKSFYSLTSFTACL